MAAKNNPSYYQHFPVTQQLQYSVHVFHLYLEQRGEHWPNTNQISIRSTEPIPPTTPPTVPPADPAGHFGYGMSCDWDVRDGLIPTGKIVARAQGLLLGTGQLTKFEYFLCQNILFTDERFKGSSLKLLGSLRIGQDYDWAIIGGTGEFSCAQGSVKQKYVNVDTPGTNLWELHIRVLCTHIPAQQTSYKDGPLGGKGGTALDIPEAPQRLESVTIRSGDVIDSVAFAYTDNAGKKQMAGPWGGNGGLPHKIPIGPTENVVKVTGTIGEFEGDTIVTSLTILTNVGTYGPFGKANGTPFNLPKNDGDKVVGFFGRAGLFLNALGVYATPSTAN